MQDLSQMSTEELLRMRNAAQQGQPAAPMRAPGVIRGPQARVNQVDQQRLDMEERRLQLSEQSEARQQQQQIRQSQQQEQGFDATEGERKAAAFLLRALGSNATYEKTGVGPRGLLDQAAKDAFPNVTNYFTSGERQAAESAQDEFIAASLRQDSGAAIPEEELERQRRIYFPMPGDGPEALEQKRQARLRAIAGLEQSAGRLLPQTQDEWARMSAELGINSPVASEGDGQPDDGILRGRVTDVGPPRPGEPGYGGDGGGGQFMTGLAQGTGDIVQGVGDTIGVFTDPFARVLADTLGFDGANMPSLGTRLREGVGLPQSPEGVVRNVNEFAAGGFAGGVAARGLGAIASPGVTQGVLRTLGRTPVRDTAAAAGAGAGASIGENLGGTPGQVAGIVLGGLSGNALANRLANVASGGVPNALMQSAERLGVQMLPADVGGVATRMASGGIGRTLGGIPMAEAAQESIGSAARARDTIAGRVGSVSDDAGAGQAVRRSQESFANNSLERANQLYSRVSVEPDAQVSLNATRQALGDVTRGFRSNPALSQLWVNHPRLRETLEALTPQDIASEGRREFMRISSDLVDAQTQLATLRNSTSGTPAQRAGLQNRIAELQRDLQRAQRQSTREPLGGELSWEDMNRFRSIVGEIIGRPGIASDGSDIGALRRLYGALTQDLEMTAAQASPRALQEFRRATQYWRGREGRLEDVFSQLLGPEGRRSNEAAFRQINQWAQKQGGDFSRLARTIRSMPQDEANTVRATIIQRMGMARPANQTGVAGDVFSPAEFSTQWQGLSQRAKSVLFPNSQHRRDLDDLAEIASAMKGANQFQNFSNTSLGVNVTAQGALALTNLPVAAALAGGQFSIGLLLANPNFARLLARTSKMSPETANRTFVEQLGVLSTRNPELSGDLDNLMRAVNDNNAGALAAEEQNP